MSTTASVASATNEVEIAPDPRRWLILAVMALAQLMLVLDATIMNIALPSAQKDLGFSLVDRQWVVTAYALSFGSLLLLGGKLADLLGRKTTFIVGLLGFAAASTFGGAAGSFGMLVAARASQGVFAALLAPAALSLLSTTFTDMKERGRAFAVYGAVAGAGGAVGLLLGGVLTQYLSWRWCMYVNVAFAAIAAIGAAVLLTHQKISHRARLDLPGAVLASGAMFCLVYGFSNAGTHGWHANSTLGALLVGAVLLAAFVLWQFVTTHPLLPLTVVADRNRAGAYLAILVSGAGMFGILLFLNFYVQQNLGYSPVRTGLAFLPMVGALMAVSGMSNVRLMPRTGPRPLVPVGLLLGAAGAAWLTRLSVQSSYPSAVLPALLLVGAGLGLVMGPVVTTGTFGVQPRDAGVASATINTGQQLGASVGTALLNTIFASAITSYLAAHAVHGRPTEALIAHAQLRGYTTAFGWSSAVFAAGAVITAALFRSGPLLARPRQTMPASKIGASA